MQPLRVFFLAIILALSTVPASQTQEQSPPQKKAGSETVIPTEQLQVEQSRSLASAATSIHFSKEFPCQLPITIHILHRSDGTGGLTLDKLPIVMESLNQRFDQTGIQFFIYGEIDHINDSHYYEETNSHVSDAENLQHLNAVPGTINVFFVNWRGGSEFVNRRNPGLYHAALVDIDSIDPFGLPVPINNSSYSYFAHEVGHYFGLFETSEKRFGAECPSGSNCSTAGDLLCDTPADDDRFVIDVFHNVLCSFSPSRNSGVQYPNCDMTPYHPPYSNIMSPSPGTCRDRFSPEQIVKMQQMLSNDNNRKNLITSVTRYVDPLYGAFNFTCAYDDPCRLLFKAAQVARPGDVIFIAPGITQAPPLDKRMTLKRWETTRTGVVEIVP